MQVRYRRSNDLSPTKTGHEELALTLMADKLSANSHSRRQRVVACTRFHTNKGKTLIFLNNRPIPFRWQAIFVSVVFVAISGCVYRPSIGQWTGPNSPTEVQIDQWSFNEERAKVLRSAHYHIYTTIEDKDLLEFLPQLMEGAFNLYCQIAPIPSISNQPMDCFVFRSRAEWDAYTQRHTGADAKIYLQIRSGGYTIRDRYVTYNVGRVNTFSVICHEGWHQFAGRNFKGRLPPFLEEGIACLFETISWDDRLPRWNLSVNTNRAQSLRKAWDANQLWTLEQLCTTHAGDIVGEQPGKIDAFYAQCWAFARFLQESEQGRYRSALQKWINETAAGTVHDPTQTHTRLTAGWNPDAIPSMLEHYLGKKCNEIDTEYRAFTKKIAFEELPAQWRS
jgi:hypothetical protein